MATTTTKTSSITCLFVSFYVLSRVYSRDIAFIPSILKPVMSTLPLLAGDLRFFASSPALSLCYINLPLFTSTISNKLNRLSLRFSPFLAPNLNYGFWGIFAASKRWFRILIVCTSCKTSYNVLSHSHWGLGQFCGGGGRGVRGNSGERGSEKTDSLPILGLQRLGSL